MVKQRKLHKPKYVFLANLSVGDLLLLLITAYNIWTNDKDKKGLISRNISATSSILTTAAMTVEKYIAVEHCLRYYAIVTWKRVKWCIVLIWLASVTVGLLPWFVELATDFSYFDSQNWFTWRSLYPFTSILLFSLAFWIRRERNRNEANIRQQKTNRFGVAQEQLHLMEILSGPIMDIVKLNVVTSTLIFFSSIVDILYNIGGIEQLRYVMASLHALYALSNPIVYIISMSELKERYKKLFRKLHKRFQRGKTKPDVMPRVRSGIDPWANLKTHSLWAC